MSGTATQASRLVVITAAGVSSAIFLHWAITQPALGDVYAMRTAFFTLLLAPASTPGPLTSVYQAATLVLAAITGLCANGLALLIELRTRPTPATRRLALALSLAAFAAAWFFFAAVHPVYRELLGYGPGPARNFFLNALGYLAGALAPYFLARFFLDYPRSATPQEWEGYFRRLRDEDAAAYQQGWHARLIPSALRGRMGPDDGGMGRQRFAISWRGAALLAGAGLVGALGDSVRAAWDDSRSWMWVQNFAAVALYLGMFATLFCGLEALRYHVRNSVDEDRRRIDWIYGTLFVGGLAFTLVAPAWWALLAFVLPPLESAGLSAAAVMLAPFSLALQLVVLAFVVALALSIFYRGSVDPRLALGRVTLLGAVGIVLALLFVVLERALAMQVAAWLSLPPETGMIMAGVVVALTTSPVRRWTDGHVTVLLTRYLPLDSVIQGERRTLAIVLSDLSGYTALSARDEKQAMLAAALLQRTAEKLCRQHGGRVVKTMGDAVLLAFDHASDAATVIDALHKDYGAAAEAIGVEALPVHSGAHCGEVTVTANGDVFGQTVNIAARLQGLAAAGQAVVSDAFARAAALDGARPLGPKVLKNVPAPVDCLELALA